MPKQCVAGLLSGGLGIAGFMLGFKFSYPLVCFVEQYIPQKYIPLNNNTLFSSDYNEMGTSMVVGFGLLGIAAGAGHYFGKLIDSAANYFQARKFEKEYHDARNVINDLRGRIEQNVRGDLEKKANSPPVQVSKTSKFKIKPTGS